MSVRILTGDCREVLKGLPDESVHCVVTSPPYWGLRDYGTGGAGVGLEPSVADHVAALRSVFADVRRVLRKDGTLWLNYGDAYAGSWGAQSRDGPVEGISATQIAEHPKRTNTGSIRDVGLKAKDLIGLPWRIALALQADGWWLRSDIIWSKPNPMPESIRDRPTKAHEYIFLLTRSSQYWYDADALKEDISDATKARYAQATPMTISGQFKGSPTDKRHKDDGGKKIDGADLPTKRNARTVWEIPTQPFPEAHFATFPPELAERCIAAGCPIGGVVLDPFGGAGTVGLVADRLQRNAILIELNPEYAAMAERRIRGDAPMFAEVSL